MNAANYKDAWKFTESTHQERKAKEHRKTLRKLLLVHVKSDGVIACIKN